MSLKPCFILPNWKHKTVPFCCSWRTPYSFVLYTLLYCICMRDSVQGFFSLSRQNGRVYPNLEGCEIVAIISQSSSPTLAPQPHSHQSQIVWGYRFRYLFTTSPHTVSCKNSSWNQSMDICCCSPVLVLTQRGELAATASRSSWRFQRLIR